MTLDGDAVVGHGAQRCACGPRSVPYVHSSSPTTVGGTVWPVYCVSAIRLIVLNMWIYTRGGATRTVPMLMLYLQCSFSSLVYFHATPGHSTHASSIRDGEGRFRLRASALVRDVCVLGCGCCGCSAFCEVKLAGYNKQRGRGDVDWNVAEQDRAWTSDRGPRHFSSSHHRLNRPGPLPMAAAASPTA
eukprot:7284303-Prymnesium_polylepis.1